MSFNVLDARKEGYSDKDIAEHLASKKNPPFKLKEALNEGHSYSQVIDHLLSNQVDSEVPVLDESGRLVFDEYKNEKPKTSIADNLIGAGETALTAATGATGGAVGMIGGTVEGIVDSIREGKFGTQEGAKQAQETAMKRAGQLTYEPRTQAGKEQTQMLGELAELIPLAPLIGSEAQVIRAATQPAKIAARAAAGSASKKIQNLINSRRPEVQVFTTSGQLTPEAMQVIQQNDLDRMVRGLLSPEQAENYNLFVSRGVQPTRADVTRSVSDQRELREALKEEGPVVDVVSGQERRIRSLIEGEADRLDQTTGGGVSTRSTAGTQIFEAMDDFATRSDRLINAAYKEAKIQGRADGRVVNPGNLATTVLSNRKADRATGGKISELEGVLEQHGILSTNANGKLVLTNKRITVEEAESLRQDMNRMHSSTKQGPEGAGARSYIRKFKEALDGDVERAVGADIFAEARKAKRDYENVIGRGKRNKRDLAKRELLKDIIENKIPEEKIVERLLSAPKAELKRIKQFLLSEHAGDKGSQAFDSFKSVVIRDLLDRSINKGTTVGGEPEFNPAKLGTAVSKFKQRGIYDELFNPEEQKLISDVIRIGEIRRPDTLVRSGRGPSSFALTALLRSPLVTKFPLLGKYISDVADDYAAKRRDDRLLSPISGVDQSVQSAASRQQR